MLDLLKQGKINDLRSAVAWVPITEALQTIHKEFPHLSSNVQSQLRECMNTRDRLAGLLIAALGLSMPQFPAFGTAGLADGDTLTDYDRARTFILNNRSSEGPRFPGLFYPELLNKGPTDRILALARSHIDCDPTKDRQINLFSLNGRYNFKTAASTTQPGGTTCALFARAVMVAAGDTRFTDKMLGKPTDQTDMIHSLGLTYTDKFQILGNGWVQATKDPINPPMPSPADVYFIRLTSGKADSGHVGFIETAVKTGASDMAWTTIDGGQKAGHSKGHWTTRNDRTFKKVGTTNNPWRLEGNQYTINGEQRRVIGWVSQAQIILDYRI